jgi:hypothetical protein
MSCVRFGEPAVVAPILCGVPAPFGWDPAGFWITVLVLSAEALVLAIGIPISTRHWHRTDRVERVRVAGILQVLATEMGGEFVEPRQVMGVDDEGDEYGPVPDYGTAAVTSSGLLVEVGVQVLGGPNGKSLRLSVAVPEGRTWSVKALRSRSFRWSQGDPYDLRTFLRSFRTPSPERLTLDARAALVRLLIHAVTVELDADALTVWALPARRRANPRISGVTDAAALVPHVHRTAAAARLLLDP